MTFPDVTALATALAPPDVVRLRVLTAVVNERKRQLIVEGFSPRHDDGHANGTLAAAAASYAAAAVSYAEAEPVKALEEPPWWPWEPRWWKPFESHVVLSPATYARHQKACLVKAAALILAELERLERSQEFHG